MQLIYASTSPYVRKVMVCAYLTDQADQIEKLPSAAHPIRRDDRIAIHNPLAKVPTLVTEDGYPLFDSRVICEYLAARSDNHTLFPVAGHPRWQALQQQAMADGLLDAALLARYEKTARPAEMQWSQWVECCLIKIQACLSSIESLAPQLSVSNPSIGEVTIGCALGYLDFRFPELAWRTQYPQAAQWFAQFDVLPAMQATRPFDAAPT